MSLFQTSLSVYEHKPAACCHGDFEAFFFFFVVPDKTALRKNKCWGQIELFPLFASALIFALESNASKQTTAKVLPPV